MQPWRGIVPRVVVWPLAPVLLAAGAAGFVAGDDTTWSDATSFLPFAVAMLACWLVGVVVTARGADQSAGWAFVGLGTALAWSTFCDGFTTWWWSGRDVPLGRLVATLGDVSFVWWFVFLALVLQYTAPGPRTGALAGLPALTLGTGVLFQAMALVRATPLAEPYASVSSPLAVPALDRPARLVAAVAVYSLAGCLLASVVVLARAWHRSDGESRRQLLWLVAGALPLVPAVIAAFALSAADQEPYAAALLGAAMVTLVAGAGLSVLRYRLYDVERVVTESAAYALASVAVVLAYLAVVLVVTRSGPPDVASTPLTVVATLAGVGAARVAYGWGRRAAGRQVNPARFRAVEVIRAGLAHSPTALDELVVQALGPGARVIYPAAGGAWVSTDGLDAAPGAAGVDVRRPHGVVARLEYDPEHSRRDVAESVAREAAAEMDNVALRAELARQVEVIRASRARLVTAEAQERRRLERDLHDGAQQRLLAVALRLQSARLNGDASVLTAEAGRAILDLRDTVEELRDLASGLQPAALAGGGLLAAVADLAARAPLELTYDVPDVRVPADIESAAWFVVAEAVTNAVKHSGAEEVEVVVRRAPQALEVEVRDGGTGGADPAGHGLQGLADRVGALGGRFHVRDRVPHGTTVEAWFPCA